MATKIEEAIVVVENLVSVLSSEDNVKKRCEELAKDNEGYVSILDIHPRVREYVQLADFVKDQEFNQLETIGIIRGLLEDVKSRISKKYSFKDDLRSKIYDFMMEAKTILSYLESDERQSISEIEINFSYKGSSWTYGELLALESQEAITNYSDIKIGDNDTYLHKDNIEECIKKHNLQNIEDTVTALEGTSIEDFDRDDIRQFLSDYDCDTIQQYAQDFQFYKDMDAFEENYVDEIVLGGIDDDIVTNCFDYKKYWSSYAQYAYRELDNGTIAWTEF